MQPDLNPCVDIFSRYQRGLSIKEVFPDRDDKTCACGCGKELTGRRRRWASELCKDAAVQYFLIIKGDPVVIREALFERDFGVCKRCGDSTGDWDAHHNHPVSLGGGACCLEGFDTLCKYCHRQVHKSKNADIDELFI